MALPQEKQGYVGDLSKKSITELNELLSRQELLLSKPNFLASLPDKGEKLYKFEEKLRQLIASKKECENRTLTTKDQEKLNIMSKTTRHDIETKSSVDKDASSRKVSKFAQERKARKIKEIPQDSSVKTVQENIAQPVHDISQPAEDFSATSSIGEYLSGQLGQECEAIDIMFQVTVTNQRPDKPKEKVTNDDFSALRDKRMHVSDIEDSLKRLDITDQHVTDQDICEDDSAKFTTHELKHIQKFNEKSTVMQEKFKPNRCLRNKDFSKHPDDHDLDGNNILTAPPDVQMQTNRRTRDPALEGPVYKFNQSKLISLEDSIQLQMSQKKTTEVRQKASSEKNLSPKLTKKEDMQAKHAAERLAERLNITMEAYNPEGIDMSYRNNEQDMDSDDDPDD